MALNPLVIPHHSRSGSTSSSLSASSANQLYDLYSANTNPNAPFPLGRPPVHGRNVSTASFTTQLTSPADSPPNVAFQHQHQHLSYPLNGSQQSFKPSPISSATVARTNSFSSRRPRIGTSPYSRTDDCSASFSTTSSRSGSCSENEPDDIAMYFANSNNQHVALGGNAMSQQQHQGGFPNGMYGNGPYGSLHPQQMAPHSLNVSPIDQAGSVVPSFGNMTLNPEAALEQLAINVRSSTTTTASDRAKQIFVQAWLTANYAQYPDGNVPRQGLYNSYRRVCDLYNIPHINTATLGKAIRLCFPNIKTRRLGVRGNSKYHYCGIRPVTVAEAEFLQDFVRRTTNHSAIAASSRRGAAAVAAAQAAARGGSSHSSGHGSDEEEDDDSEASSTSYDTKEPVYNFTAGLPHHPSNFGGSGTGSVPPHLNTGSFPHPLTLGGGLKSPTLFSMDDKTPTTNTLLSMAQAQSLSMGMGGIPGNGSFGGNAAQIRGRRGIGSMDSAGGASRPGTSGSGVSSASAPGFGQGGLASSGFGSQGPSPLLPMTMSMPVSVRNLPNFPSINEALGADSMPVSTGSEQSSSTGGSPSSVHSGSAHLAPTPTSPQNMAALQVWRWFEDHLDQLLECVRTWRLDQFEGNVRNFWGSLSGDYREVVHAPAVAGLMVKADAIVYDEILESLKSHMLNPIPQQSLAALRHLAEKMEKILLVALEGYGSTFVEPKVELGARFGHLVLRFLDMFQVTQALTSVLSNPQQLSDMRRAWSEIDFESVRNQSALVCNCRHEDLVQLLEGEFVTVLDGLVNNVMLNPGSRGSPGPVREIMAWADACCEKLMGGTSAPGEERSQMSSRSILIRWGYVTSQVMRDLTIRSDPAFGAYQILKLFLDDWIALNVLRSVALSTNSVQASVEPVMLQQQQQQYLALSPMTGQEFTGPGTSSDSTRGAELGVGVQSITSTMLNQTPTTTSMLAALQGDASGVQSYTASQPGQSHTMTYNEGRNPGFYDSFGDGTAAGPFDMSFFNTQSSNNSPMHQQAQQASPSVLGVAGGDQANALSPARSTASGGGLDVPSGAVEDLVRRESEERGLDTVAVKHETEVGGLAGN